MRDSCAGLPETRVETPRWGGNCDLSAMHRKRERERERKVAHGISWTEGTKNGTIEIGRGQVALSGSEVGLIGDRMARFELVSSSVSSLIKDWEKGSWRGLFRPSVVYRVRMLI